MEPRFRHSYAACSQEVGRVTLGPQLCFQKLFPGRRVIAVTEREFGGHGGESSIVLAPVLQEGGRDSLGSGFWEPARPWWHMGTIWPRGA